MRPVSLIFATALFGSLTCLGGDNIQAAGLAGGSRAPTTEKGITLIAPCVSAPRCATGMVAVCMTSYQNPRTRRRCCTSWKCSGGPF